MPAAVNPATIPGNTIRMIRAMKSQRRKEILESRNHVKNRSQTRGLNIQRVNR